MRRKVLTVSGRNEPIHNGKSFAEEWCRYGNRKMIAPQTRHFCAQNLDYIIFSSICYDCYALCHIRTELVTYLTLGIPLFGAPDKFTQWTCACTNLNFLREPREPISSTENSDHLNMCSLHEINEIKLTDRDDVLYDITETKYDYILRSIAPLHNFLRHVENPAFAKISWGKFVELGSQETWHECKISMSRGNGASTKLAMLQCLSRTCTAFAEWEGRAT